MANISITAGNVVPQPGYSKIDGIAGEVITPGQPLYLKEADGRYYKARAAAAGNAAERVVVGIAINQAAAAGQPIDLITTGDLAVGAVLTQGASYYLSDTAGAIMPVADLSTGEFVVFLGVAISTSQLRLGILNSGVAIP